MKKVSGRETNSNSARRGVALSMASGAKRRIEYDVVAVLLDRVESDIHSETRAVRGRFKSYVRRVSFSSRYCNFTLEEVPGAFELLVQQAAVQVSP